MKAKILTLVIIATIANACSKDSFSDKPGLTLKSVNGTTFATNSTITFSFKLTNKNAEQVTDTLFILRKFSPTCSFITTDTTKFIVPPFDATSKQVADIDYSYVYGSGGRFNGCTNGTTSKTDSLNFYFWVKDKHGMSSDTVSSPKIILLK